MPDTNPIIEEVTKGDSPQREDQKECYIIGVVGDEADVAIGNVLTTIPGITMDREKLDPPENPTNHDHIADRIISHISVWGSLPNTGFSDQSLEDVPIVLYVRGMTPRIAHVVSQEVDVNIGVVKTEGASETETSKFKDMGVPVENALGKAPSAEKVLQALNGLIEIWEA